MGIGTSNKLHIPIEDLCDQRFILNFNGSIYVSQPTTEISLNGTNWAKVHRSEPDMKCIIECDTHDCGYNHKDTLPKFLMFAVEFIITPEQFILHTIDLNTLLSTNDDVIYITISDQNLPIKFYSNNLIPEPDAIQNFLNPSHELSLKIILRPTAWKQKTKNYNIN